MHPIDIAALASFSRAARYAPRAPVLEAFARTLSERLPPDERAERTDAIAVCADHLSSAVSGFAYHREPPCHVGRYTRARRVELMLRASLYRDEFSRHQLFTNLRLDAEGVFDPITEPAHAA